MTEMYWLKWDREPWNANSTTSKFTGTICSDEEKINNLVLPEQYVKVVICNDYTSEEIMSKGVILGETVGYFEFFFTEDELPPIGEYKIELYVLDDDGEILGMTHHDDFEVESN